MSRIDEKKKNRETYSVTTIRNNFRFPISVTL